MKYLVLCSGLFLSGCASSTKQTDALYSSRWQMSTTAQNSAPFIQQDAGHCGPATLTMAIQSTGTPADLQEITEQVYSPGAKGSLQTDIISSARRQGMMAVQINGLQALLQEIEAGHSVIIFENLGIKWIPQWHYALVTGYDLQRKVLTMHSGPNPNQKIDIAEFELAWKQGDYWGLVILKPGQLAASGDELAHLQAAASLEQINKLPEAQLAYLSILSKWPRSLIAHIGMGNIYYKLEDYNTAVDFLRIATMIDPESKAAIHNLQVARAAQAVKNMK